MPSSARPIAAILGVVAIAAAFWMLALSPKRNEADHLSAQIAQLNSGIQAAQSEVVQATAARHSFPAAYHQLVEVGQAVPSTDETPSLLIELDKLANDAGVKFESIQLEGEGESEEVVESSNPAESTSAGAAPATEVEASLLPLGASIGSAGLAVMPYTLQFEGNFFQIASFIGKVDALVKSNNGSDIAVDGRLITISSFSLSDEAQDESSGGSARLSASFSVTTYLTPPGQGITAGASPSAPAGSASTQTVAAK